jgi:surface adhesion protein
VATSKTWYQHTPAVTTVTDTIDTTTVKLTATASSLKAAPSPTPRPWRASHRLAGCGDPGQRPDHHHRSRQTTGTVNFTAPNDALTGTRR